KNEPGTRNPIAKRKPVDGQRDAKPRGDGEKGDRRALEGQNDNGKDGACTRAGADADNVGARERIAQHGLEGDTGHAETQPGKDGENGAWQSQLTDGKACALNVLPQEDL